MEPYTITHALETLIRIFGALILGLLSSSNLVFIFTTIFSIIIMSLVLLFAAILLIINATKKTGS